MCYSSENAGKSCMDVMDDSDCAPAIIHVYGCAIVPDSEYEIQAIDPMCDDSSQCAAPLTVTTPKWGDLVGFPVGDTGAITWTPPDGEVCFTTDVRAVIDKFNGVTDAPIKARCDVYPDQPDLKITILDINFVVQAFQSVPYPFQEPNLCPAVCVCDPPCPDPCPP